MKAIKANRRIVFVVSIIFIAASIVGVAVFSAKRQQTKPRKEWLTSVPELGSKVENLQIINARIVRQNTDAPAVAFEILNNSSRGVMAIEISCGNGSIAQDGLEDDENPTVIIKPYGTMSAEMNELVPGKPIVITAAVFDDAKEEGQKSSLDLMKKVRARQRAALKAKKQQAPGRNSNQ